MTTELTTPPPLPTKAQPRTPTLQIKALIDQFRCLRNKYKIGETEDFDAIQFEKHSRAWASGERQAALFVLAVWSGNNWQGKGKAFDIVHAVSTLDHDDIEVLITWMRKPFWP